MATDHSLSSLTTAAAAADDAGVNITEYRRPTTRAFVVGGNSEQMSSPTATAVSAAPGFFSPPPGQAFGSGVESSGHEAQPESSDANSECNAGGPKRPAWNMPSNGVVDGGSVMGGDISWPALSESTRHGPRSSLDSVRPDYFLTSKFNRCGVDQTPIILTPPCRQANANSAANSTTPIRPRSINRGGGGGGGGSPSVSGPSQNNFRDVNLMTDNFLKSNMDDHGWMPITLIASFPRVHLLMQYIPLF